MDSAEALALLRAGADLGQTLADSASRQHALGSSAAAQAHQSMIDQLDPARQGAFRGAVGGQSAFKASSGSRALDPNAPVEQFGKPLVLMASAATINWASPASTLLFAGRHLHWSTQGDMHLAAQQTIAAVAANAVGLFTHAGGIEAVAANAPLSLQAHTDALEILADQDITVLSVNDAIEIKAKQKIVLQAGQSSITLDGGNITFACPGNFTVKGGQHLFDGGASAPARLPDLPEGVLPKDSLYLDHRYHDDQPLAGAAYRVTFADGSKREGKLDGQGRAVLTGVPAGTAQVSYGPMPGVFERVDNTPTPNYDAKPSNAKLDGLIDKYLKLDDRSGTSDAAATSQGATS